MATTYIPISTGQRLGARLRSAVDQAGSAWGQLQALYAVMGTMVDSAASPPSYALIETQFGLQAGQGATLYTLLQTVIQTGDASAALAELLTQCG